MIRTFLIVACAMTLAAPVTTWARALVRRPLPYPVHLDPQATSLEYEAALRARPHRTLEDTPDDRQLSAIVAAGKRNLDWLIYINAHRDTPLSFTKPGTLPGYPITTPKKYSGKLVIEDYQKFLAEIPASMRDVLDKGQAFTTDPPIATDEYLRLGHEMDKIYQTATRWQLMLPNLPWYASYRTNDIRGYYFLKDIADLEGKLRGWDSLPDLTKSELRSWLLGECINTQEQEAGCATEFSTAEQSKTVWDFHQSYVAASKAMFEGFFQISSVRPDLSWKKNAPEQASLPFKLPGVQAVQDFLAKNIEDEWKWKAWHLHLDFQPEADVHVEFEPGVTPHVNGIGGNTITMDANAPLSEWDVQWTIRHEFGHVLGFPDCYVEYYDPTEAVMVTYQIDINNLMCSRSGRFLQTHFDELQKAYLKD